MTTIAEVGQLMQEILGKIADEEGRRSGFIRRERKLKGSSYAQALVFGWMSNPSATVNELAAAAATLGVSISKQGLDKRFNERSACLMERLLQRAVSKLVEGEALRAGVFENFSEVHVLDSTSISLPEALSWKWPGCNKSGQGSAALKVSVDWELIRGRLVGIHLQAGKAHDQASPLAQQPLPENAIWLRDLGYFNLKQFAHLNSTGSYFLSRLKASCRLYRPDGQPFDWTAELLDCQGDYLELEVLVGARHLPCRLLAWRVPDDIAEQRRQHLQEVANDHAHPVSPCRWNTAHWSVYITNAPATLLSLFQAQVLAKVRWQIELLFKLWKTDGLLDEWRTTDPWRALTECFAKLLALLIQHWCLLLGAWALPNRSLHQAVLLIRKHAFHLAAVFSHPDLLLRALSIIQSTLSTCRMSSLAQHPHTFQLIARGSLA